MTETKTVFRIIDKGTQEVVPSYNRSYHDKFDFASVGEARTANCHGMFKNKDKFAINEYRVTYTLVNRDVDANEDKG